MQTVKDCAIIGAGILGCLIAAALSELGHRVTVYEREPMDQSGKCSVVAAAMLSPFCELDYAEPIIMKMGVRSLEIWPTLISKYAKNVFYQNTGSLVVAHPSERGELERFNRRVQRHAKNAPVVLTKEDLIRLEPELSHAFAEGLFLPGEAQIDGKSFLRALQKSLAANGVNFIDIAPIDKVTSNQVGTEKYDWVIDCRGMGAKKELTDLRGVRGEIIEVEAPEVKLSRSVRIMHPRYPLYIVPRPNDRYLIGATTLECHSEKGVTVRSALELLSSAFSAHPGFAESSIIDLKMGVRPAFNDNLPRITCEKGIVRVNGLYRHGFLLAPILAQWLGNAIHNEELKTNDFHITKEKLWTSSSTVAKHKQKNLVLSETFSSTVA